MFIRANPDSHGVVIEALSHGRRRRRTENERSHSQLVTGNVHANLRRMWTLGNLVLSHIVNAFASDEGLSSGLTPDHFRLHMSNSMSTTSLLMRSSLHKSVTSLNVVSSSVRVHITAGTRNRSLDACCDSLLNLTCSSIKISSSRGIATVRR